MRRASATSEPRQLAFPTLPLLHYALLPLCSRPQPYPAIASFFSIAISPIAGDSSVRIVAGGSRHKPSSPVTWNVDVGPRPKQSPYSPSPTAHSTTTLAITPDGPYLTRLRRRRRRSMTDSHTHISRRQHKDDQTKLRANTA